MKKVFISMIALLAVSTMAMASGRVDSVRYQTTKAGKNWYISAGATCNWWQGSMRAPEGFTKSYTAVEWGKPTFGFNVFVGKWINHKVGVKLGYSNTKINSYIYGRHSGLNHIQYLYGDDPQPVEVVNGMEIYKTSMRYHRLQADFMLSPIDFFQGYYNPKRVWTPVLYVSMGGAYTSKDFFALKSVIDNAKAMKLNPDNPETTAANFELALGAGLSNNFRLGTHFDLNLDLSWTFQKWTLDSWTYEFQGSFAGKSVRPKRFDNMYTASVGLIYHFSREYDMPINCCEEMDSLRRKLDMFVNMPKEETTPQEPCDTIVKFVNVQTEEVLSYPFSIFFNRDSYQLMSRRDVVNLREIANVAKENGYKIRLTGSCDSATASASYNQTLSENRCNKIKTELLELGIPEDHIIIDPVGGVKKLDPTEYDRRVLIQLMKEAE